LSFCSVLIVVWAALIINTVVEKGPIIFLKLAEGNVGQYDGIIYPQNSRKTGSSGFTNSYGVFLNFTRVEEATNSKYNFAPRKQMCGTYISSTKPVEQRRKYDEKYLKSKQKDYVSTTDGKIKIPPRSEIYSMKNKYRSY
jgi:hypothetical protein